MTIKNVIDNSLQLLDDFSIDGVPVLPIDISDYTLKCPGLINACQMEISNRRFIKANFILMQSGVDVDGYNPYDISDYEFKELKYILFNNVKFLDYILTNDTLFLPKNYSGQFTIFYIKYPTEVTSTTVNTTPLEIDVDVQPLVPYYVGAYLALPDNKKVSAVLLQMYQSKLSMIRQIKDKTFTTITDLTGWL